MKDRHFRAGVGTVIYNEAGQVAVFRRLAPPAGVQQFQQGGIDAGEDVETTLWRELRDETGLTKDQIAQVNEYPTWTLQVYPSKVLNDPNNINPDRLGQAHRWFFLKLKADVQVDLTTASDKEFDQWRWTTWEEAINMTSDYKSAIYRELHDYFTTHIIN